MFSGEKCTSKNDVEKYIKEINDNIELCTRQGKADAFDRIADLDNFWIKNYESCKDFLSFEEYIDYKKLLQNFMLRISN